MREDLSDTIYNITPEETPFISRVGRGPKANARMFEWQTDALDAPDGSNAHIEGDETTFQALVPTVRVANYTQISKKAIVISATEEVVSKAGRKSEEAYQMAKKAVELRRDMEKIALSNQVGAIGSEAAARTTAGLLAWIRTNTDHEVTGADPDAPSPVPADARTDGVLRAFAESQVQTVVQAMYDNGANVGRSFLMVGTSQKVDASSFEGIATKTYNISKAERAAIVAAADVYVSDFGTFSIIPNRIQRSRDAFFIDPEFVKLSYLRPFKREKLAKTGDAEKRHLIVEWGLRVNNEAALGLIADLS